MGGRVYDPNLGRFLSADIYVQSPYNSQSFNRYSYTFNNPLSYTDPTGYSSEMMQYFMEQAHQRSASWSWSTTVSYMKTERTLWEGHTKGMSDYHYWWETNTSTVNSVNAGSIFQTTSYNMPSWGAGPFRINNFEPGFRQQCGGDAQCMQNMRIDEAQHQLGIMSFAVGGEAAFIGKALWEARTAKVLADSLKAGNGLGRIQSRINISNEGWAHILKRHFSGKANASQFSVGKDELKSLLQSKQVVGSPITRTIESADGLRYVREINMGRNIGVDAMKGNSNTSIMTTMSDKYGNLITAFPGVLK